MPASRKQKAILRWKTDELSAVDDTVSIEEPLEIRLGYYEDSVKRRVNISVTMRTPGNDNELALGFLFSEGIIDSPETVEQVRRIDPGFRKSQRDNIIQVDMRPGFVPNMDLISRNFYTTSSCGVCGKTSIELVQDLIPSRFEKSYFTLNPGRLGSLPEVIRKAQEEFESTGAIHAAALFNQNLELQLIREDVGRHNALDKVIGAAFQAKSLPLQSSVLILSGRASFELIQKASHAGIPVVAAIGAPSSLAVELAEESDITLIGFLKSNRMNVYTGFERIKED